MIKYITILCALFLVGCEGKCLKCEEREREANTKQQEVQKPKPKNVQPACLYDAKGNKYDVIGRNARFNESKSPTYYFSLKYVPIFRNEDGTEFFTCTQGAILIRDIEMNKVTNPEDYKMFFEKVPPPNPQSPQLEKKE